MFEIGVFLDENLLYFGTQDSVQRLDQSVKELSGAIETEAGKRPRFEKWETSKPQTQLDSKRGHFDIF